MLESQTMIADSQAATRLPAQDLERARRFYAAKLGLKPIEERPGGLLYRCGSGHFALFQSAGSASGAHTQMSWEVADIDATVAALRTRGVIFEEYDLPGLKTVNGIAEIQGNYPSKSAKEARGSGTARVTCSALGRPCCDELSQLPGALHAGPPLESVGAAAGAAAMKIGMARSRMAAGPCRTGTTRPAGHSHSKCVAPCPTGVGGAPRYALMGD